VNNIKAIGVIPARIKSSRFPEKVIHNIIGKPMILHVYNQAKKAELLNDIIVATDSMKVVKVCDAYSIPVILTSHTHKTGTDRVFELSTIIDANIYVNIQGDEPLIKGEMIDLLLKPYLDSNFYGVTTLKTRIKNNNSIMNPNIVKVITDSNDFAIDFIREIPAKSFNDKDIIYYKHIGLYSYPKELLSKIYNFPRSEREKKSSLEQLRFLDNNIQIKVMETPFDTIGVDVYDDIIRVEEVLKGIITCI